MRLIGNDYLGFASYQTELDRLADDLADKAFAGDYEAELDDTFLVMGKAEIKYIQKRLKNKYGITANLS